MDSTLLLNPPVLPPPSATTIAVPHDRVQPLLVTKTKKKCSYCFAIFVLLFLLRMGLYHLRDIRREKARQEAIKDWKASLNRMGPPIPYRIYNQPRLNDTFIRAILARSAPQAIDKRNPLTNLT